MRQRDRSTRQTSERATPGGNGRAIAPPRYGMDFVDRRNVRVVQPRATRAPAAASGRGVIQRRMPPLDAFEVAIDLSGGYTMYGALYRLLHVEVAQKRLVRPVEGTKYTDAWQAADEVFPNGIFDRDAYAALYEANQKYAQVLPPSQDIRETELPDLRHALERAIEVAKQCATRTLWIRQVFGLDLDPSPFQETYRTVAKRLAEFTEKNFGIDYNRDDPEMGVGGYSMPGSGKIQVSPSALAMEVDELAVTLIHEACHETDKRIIDIGYYGSARFDNMSAKQKATNAAHYEEVARRIVGKSGYAGQAFTPVAEQKKEGKKKQEVIRKLRPATEGLRKLWSKSVDVHYTLRLIASGTSTLSKKQKVGVVNMASAAFQLPQTGVKDEPYLSHVHLAMVESIVNVLNRAQTHAEKIKKEKDQEKREALTRMSTIELVMEAIQRAGGFQGVSPEINANLVNSMRENFILYGFPDPFLDFD